MKGIAILAILVAVIGAALFALLKSSDTDLVRIEEEIGSTLDEVNHELLAVTRTVDALRSIRPDILVLDRDLAGNRSEETRQRQQLESLQRERPKEGEDRASFIENRRQARRAAEELRRRVEDLDARASILHSFMLETQPRVKVMIAAFGDLFQLKEQKLAEGKTLDDEILVKIDYLKTDVERKRSLAKSVFETGSQSAQDGKVLNDTARKEIELVIEEIHALARRLETI